MRSLLLGIRVGSFYSTKQESLPRFSIVPYTGPGPIHSPKASP